MSSSNRNEMSPRKWLGLIVRTVALLMWMYGLYIAFSTIWDFFVAAIYGQVGDFPLLHIGLNSIVPVVAYWVGGWLVIRNADRIVRIAYPHRVGFCDQCGYDLRSSSGRCPECGTPVKDDSPPV